MKTELQYFEAATPIAEYMDGMTDLKEGALKIYHDFTLPNNSEELQALKDSGLRILIITEHWCGDALINNSILRNIADYTGLDVRCVFRDEDTELINRYLTNGGSAIPIFLFLNEQGEVVGKWGPRAPELQENVMNKRKELPPKDADNYEEAQKELYRKINENYLVNDHFWNLVYKSQKDALLAAVK